ncbi:hypothetical protein RRG08_006205, partial [Elysia crispata]
LCFALSLVAVVVILHLCWVSYVDRLVIPFPFYLQLWRNASCLECLRPMPARTGPQGSDHQARCPVPKYGAFPETRQVVFGQGPQGCQLHGAEHPYPLRHGQKPERSAAQS